MVVVMLLLVGTLSGLVSAAYSNGWADDPADCPNVYQSQDCSPNNVCGYDGSITYCYDTTTFSPPGSSRTQDVNVGAFDGGYLVYCTSSLDNAEPYCDNNGNFWCDAESTCQNQDRNTICSAGSWGVSSCGTCKSGYKDCDCD